MIKINSNLYIDEAELSFTLLVVLDPVDRMSIN